MKVKLLRCYILRGTKKWDFHIFVHDWTIRCEKDFSEDVFWFSISESSQLPLQIWWWFMKYSNQLSCKYFWTIFCWWIFELDTTALNVFIAMFIKQLIFCFIFSFKYWSIRILYMSKFLLIFGKFFVVACCFYRSFQFLFLYDRSCIDIFRIYVPPQILK